MRDVDRERIDIGSSTGRYGIRYVDTSNRLAHRWFSLERDRDHRYDRHKEASNSRITKAER